MRQWCIRIGSVDNAILGPVVSRCESTYLQPGRFALRGGQGTRAEHILQTGKAVTPQRGCTNGGGFSGAGHGIKGEPWPRALTCLSLHSDQFREDKAVRVQYDCISVLTLLPGAGNVIVHTTTSFVKPGCQVVQLQFPVAIEAYGARFDFNPAYNNSTTLHICSSGANSEELTVQPIGGQDRSSNTLLAVVISWSALTVVDSSHIEVDVPPASILDEVVGKPCYTRHTPPEFTYTRVPRVRSNDPQPSITIPSASVIEISSGPRTLPHILSAWVDKAVAFEHAYRAVIEY